MYKFVILSVSVFAVILIAQSNAAQQSNLDKLKAQFLPPEFAGTNFTIDDAKKVLREKCRKVSGDNETVYLSAQKAITDFGKCITVLANLTALQEEIEIAKPIGELDTVFSKYCDKRPQAESCVNELNAKIQPCLNDEEKANNAAMLRLATKLLGFICQKGGDQIALFVAEQGPECLEANKENINGCMNASFAGYMPKNGIPDVNSLPQFVMGKKECIDLQDFEECVLYHLEKCNDITPSNIIESMFKFVNNETKCQPPIVKTTRNEATSHTHTFTIAIVGSLMFFILQKIFSL